MDEEGRVLVLKTFFELHGGEEGANQGGIGRRGVLAGREYERGAVALGNLEGKGGPRLDESAGALKEVNVEDEVVVGHGDNVGINGDSVGGDRRMSWEMPMIGLVRSVAVWQYIRESSSSWGKGRLIRVVSWMERKVLEAPVSTRARTLWPRMEALM